MAREMKVWSTSTGRSYKVVATTTKKAAAEAMKVSLYEFNLYASETDNPESNAAALSEPGTVFSKSNSRYDDTYERWDGYSI